MQLNIQGAENISWHAVAQVESNTTTFAHVESAVCQESACQCDMTLVGFTALRLWFVSKEAVNVEALAC